MTQIHTDDRFDDEVFRAIAASESDNTDDTHQELADENMGTDDHSDPVRPDLPMDPEPKPVKRLSVRDAASQIDQRIQALAEWLDHLEGVEPVTVWESGNDEQGRRMAVQIVRDTDAGWRIEATLAEQDNDAEWGAATDRPIAERVRLLRLSQTLLKDVVEQQRKLILDLRAAVKDFDSSAAALGVKIAR